ncbi:hypothetical protein GQ54DRAFT_129824 [Martensiomyces pterosporus]|nr:hypothetical protein GQ54DRAFT_129824 [Martensiomyces pterosporus]
MADSEMKGPVSALESFPQVQKLAEAYPSLLNKQWVGGSGDGSDALLPIGIFTTLHAIRIAYEVRKSVQANGRRPLLQELFTMLTFSFGGAILTALALGRVQPWLQSNTMVPVYGGAYLAMSILPGDILFRFLRRTSPISDVFLASVDGLLRGYGVTAAGVDLVRKTMKGQPVSESLIAWIFVGTVLGSGGGIIDDFLQISRASWGFRTPSMVFNGFSLDVKLSFFATVGYILTTHAWSFTAHAPGFPLSPALDSILSLVPHLSEEEARLISGLLCSAALGTAAHFQARTYAVAERHAAESARRKKDDDAGVESDGEVTGEKNGDSAN